MDKKGIRFETGISENYLPNWGTVEGVREFVQNGVFAQTSLKDTLTIDYRDGQAIIHNTPSGIAKGKLLVGESDQRSIQGSPGYFGEGIKCGMLVLLRNGINIKLETNGFTVIPALEPSKLDEDVKTLVFYIQDTDKHNGTTVTIQCTEKELEEAKEYFMILQGIDDELTKKDCLIPEYGKLVSNTKPINVNGVKVTEYNAIFQYNFTNPELMNRDRTSMDMFKVRQEVAKVLSEIQDIDTAIKVIEGVLEDDKYLESQAGINGWQTNVDIWRQAVKKLFGAKVAIATGLESDTQARYRGYKLITNLSSKWRYFFEEYLNIPLSANLQVLAKKAKRIHRKPRGEEAQNLGWAKRLIKIYYNDYGTVRVSEDLKDTHGNSCLGLYSRKTDTIWLDKEILNSKELTFKTLLHETIHRVTGANDNTEEFTAGWEHASWMILTRGKGE